MSDKSRQDESIGKPIHARAFVRRGGERVFGGIDSGAAEALCVDAGVWQ
jgi:hypothetical protein